MSDGWITPEAAAKVLCVCTKTLGVWAKQGKIEYRTTPGGHKRYKLPRKETRDRGKDERSESAPRRRVCYARVSGYSQKEDLERQISFLREKFPTHQMVQDIGSGLNYKRKGLRTILGYALRGELQELVVTYKDRLMRWGFELLQEIVRNSNGKILVLNAEKDSSPEEELTRDLLSIVTVFSARIHGIRSGRNKYKANGIKNSESWKEAEGKLKDVENKNISLEGTGSSSAENA